MVCVTLPRTALAAALAKPDGLVILTILGEITNKIGPNGATFDREQLLALGTETEETTTHFTKGRQRFEGVRLRKVLDAVGANGRILTAKALDGYSIDIPVDDVDRFELLLAMTWNGKVMRVRNKGPIWVIYPINRFPETSNEFYSVRTIWQLTTLTVR